MPKVTEKEDAAEVKVELKGDAPAPDPNAPKVTLAQPPKPKETELSDQTKAEQEAGKKAVEESEKAAKAQVKPA